MHVLGDGLVFFFSFCLSFLKRAKWVLFARVDRAGFTFAKRREVTSR